MTVGRAPPWPRDGTWISAPLPEIQAIQNLALILRKHLHFCLLKLPHHRLPPRLRPRHNPTREIIRTMQKPLRIRRRRINIQLHHLPLLIQTRLKLKRPTAASTPRGTDSVPRGGCQGRYGGRTRSRSGRGSHSQRMRRIRARGGCGFRSVRE